MAQNWWEFFFADLHQRKLIFQSGNPFRPKGNMSVFSFRAGGAKERAKGSIIQSGGRLRNKPPATSYQLPATSLPGTHLNAVVCGLSIFIRYGQRLENSTTKSFITTVKCLSYYMTLILINHRKLA